MNGARDLIRKHPSAPSEKDSLHVPMTGKINGDGDIVILVILACCTAFFVGDAISNFVQILSTPQSSLQSWGSFIGLHISSIAKL